MTDQKDLNLDNVQLPTPPPPLPHPKAMVLTCFTLVWFPFSKGIIILQVLVNLELPRDILVHRDTALVLGFENWNKVKLRMYEFPHFYKSIQFVKCSTTHWQNYHHDAEVTMATLEATLEATLLKYSFCGG